MNINNLSSKLVSATEGDLENQHPKNLLTEKFSALLADLDNKLKSDTTDELQEFANALDNILPASNGLNNETGELNIELTAVAEKIKQINVNDSMHSDTEEKMTDISNEFQPITDVLSKKEPQLLNASLPLGNQYAPLYLDNVEDNNMDPNEKDISSDLDEQINEGAVEVTSGKQIFIENLSPSFHQTQPDGKIQDGTQQLEKLTSTTISNELNPNNKKTISSIPSSPVTEEKPIALSTESRSNTLLNQKNNSHKAKQGLTLNSAVSNNHQPPSVSMNSEPEDDKTLAKFTTDLAMLNRMVVSENKVEIPGMNKNISHPEWNKEMGERVIWMHKQTIPTAELRLNPAHLGPVTIKIETNAQEQTSISFTTQHAVVKDAIEQAMPKLRDMFTAQQLNLVEVNVSHNDSEQRQARDFNHMQNGEEKMNRGRNQAADKKESEKEMEITEESETSRSKTSKGVLSLYA